MTLNCSVRQRLVSTLLPLSLLGFGALAQAQEEICTPLAVVGAPSQTEVSKTVSLPSFLVNTTNWNTDFAVSSHADYSRFVVSIVSTVGTTYDLAVNLKYNDNTLDRAYQENGATLSLNQPFTIDVATRSGQTPYQVNILVGGPNSVENEYRASVMGCVN